MTNIELGFKVFSFLDSFDWSLTGDLSGIELEVNGKKLSISFSCAQCICWDHKVLNESIEKSMFKKILAKAFPILNKLNDKRNEECKKKHAEFIQNVLQEMG